MNDDFQDDDKKVVDLLEVHGPVRDKLLIEQLQKGLKSEISARRQLEAIYILEIEETCRLESEAEEAAKAVAEATSRRDDALEQARVAEERLQNKILELESASRWRTFWKWISGLLLIATTVFGYLVFFPS